MPKTKEEFLYKKASKEYFNLLIKWEAGFDWDTFFSISQAAKLMWVSRPTMYSYIANRKIRAYSFFRNKRWYYILGKDIAWSFKELGV